MFIEIIEEAIQKYFNKESEVDKLKEKVSNDGFNNLTSEEISKLNTVIINDTAYINVFFSIEVDVDSKIVMGKISTEDYIDDIKSIENSRYNLNGIEVTKLYIGSDDNKIIYDFVAPMDKLEIKY